MNEIKRYKNELVNEIVGNKILYVAKNSYPVLFNEKVLYTTNDYNYFSDLEIKTDAISKRILEDGLRFDFYSFYKLPNNIFSRVYLCEKVGYVVLVEKDDLLLVEKKLCIDYRGSEVITLDNAHLIDRNIEFVSNYYLDKYTKVLSERESLKNDDIYEMNKDIENSILCADSIIKRVEKLKNKLEWFKKIVDKEIKRNRVLEVRELLDNAIEHWAFDDEDTLDFFNEMKEELGNMAFSIEEYNTTLEDFKESR